MEWAAPISLLLSAGGGAILLELTRRALDAVSSRGKLRRDEVDRAITERDTAKKRADAAEQAEDLQARRVRIVEESLAVHRRVIIDAPCLGPDYLPSYPYRKE